MRLNWVLWSRKRFPKGHIYRGKYRLVQPVTMDHLLKLKNSFAIEEANMHYLRYPYLTEAQEAVFKAARPPKSLVEKAIEANRAKFKKSISIEERLAHLRTNERWE